jgi:hypothetical protein
MTGMAFMRSFTRTRAIAQRHLNGPRSVRRLSERDATDDWFEPSVTVLQTVLSPLFVQSISIFERPRLLESTADFAVWIRSCQWRGEEDKKKSKNSFVELPAVNTEYRAIDRDQVVIVDKAIRELDSALGQGSVSIEGLNTTSQAPADPGPAPENTSASVSTEVLWKVRRIGRFIEREVRWHSSDQSVELLTSSTRRLWESILVIVAACHPIDSGEVDEVFDIGESPDDIVRLVASEK